MEAHAQHTAAQDVAYDPSRPRSEAAYIPQDVSPAHLAGRLDVQREALAALDRRQTKDRTDLHNLDDRVDHLTTNVNARLTKLERTSPVFIGESTVRRLETLESAQHRVATLKFEMDELQRRTNHLETRLRDYMSEPSVGEVVGTMVGAAVVFTVVVVIARALTKPTVLEWVPAPTGV